MSSSVAETWSGIPGIEHYEASSAGRIRSLYRLVRCGPGYKGSRPVPAMVMRTFVSRATGYMQVALLTKRYSVHRLVAMAFLGEPPTKKHMVNHKNGVRHDNRVENLEWCTLSENIKHAYAELGAKASCQGVFSKDHPASKPVVSRNVNNGEIRAWDCGMDAVREGFDSSSISRCCSGQYKTHKGHEWRLGAEWPSK